MPDKKVPERRSGLCSSKKTSGMALHHKNTPDDNK
jgi:hypothetical protein